jgi:Cu/Ag efflux protein CusF
VQTGERVFVCIDENSPHVPTIPTTLPTPPRPPALALQWSGLVIFRNVLTDKGTVIESVDRWRGSKMPFLAARFENYMNRPYITLVLCSIAFVSACSTPEVKNASVVGGNATLTQHSGTPQAASTQPRDGDYPGKGKVTKINTDLGSIELNHEEIVGVMPAMIMEFYVKDKALLNGLTVGDNVEFTLEYKHPSETIVGITKVK